MKSKTKILVFLFAIIIIFSACQNNQSSKSSVIDVDSSVISGDLHSDINIEPSEKIKYNHKNNESYTFDELNRLYRNAATVVRVALIGKPTEEEKTIVAYYLNDILDFTENYQLISLGESYYETYYSDLSNLERPFIHNIIRYFPTKACRKINDHHFYLVYQTEDNYRIFIFGEDNLDDYVAIGQCLIIRDKLNKDDFSGIKKGSTIYDVGLIDSNISIYLRSYHFTEIENEKKATGEYYNSSYSTLHYLTDGIIKIVYDYVDGEFIVSDIIYNKYHMLNDKMTGYDEKNQSFIYEDMYYHINEDDLPWDLR